MNIQAERTGVPHKKTLALFDFDGTLTFRDSFLDFLLFTCGKLRCIAGFAFLLPVMAGYKTKIISNQSAKEIVYQHFLKGWEEKRFMEYCRAYARERLPEILSPPAWNKMEWHLQNKHTVVIVSASLEEYLQPWAEQFDIQVIGSRLKFKDGCFTGKLDGLNCYGPEKVRRIRTELHPEQFQEVYAYGDSEGDREMLQLSDHPFYRRYD